MTYTRPKFITPASPNRAANQFDDALREIRVDMQERGQDLLAGIGDWTTDPVVTIKTYYQYLHWSTFRVLDGKSSVMGANVYIAATAKEYPSALNTYGISVCDGGSPVTAVFAGRLFLPVPCTLVDVDVTCFVDLVGAGQSITGEVLLVDATTTTPTETSLVSRTLSDTTTQGNYSLSSGGEINQAVLATDTEHVWVKISIASDSATGLGMGFQGVRVTYTHHPLGYV